MSVSFTHCTCHCPEKRLNDDDHATNQKRIPVISGSTAPNIAIEKEPQKPLNRQMTEVFFLAEGKVLLNGLPIVLVLAGRGKSQLGQGRVCRFSGKHAFMTFVDGSNYWELMIGLDLWPGVAGGERPHSSSKQLYDLSAAIRDDSE
uniref:NTR domain-containing protein n=1 Tax=Panagrellus redivivus TaxID=6233 RepID=A0A7E4VS13_PANRE